MKISPNSVATAFAATGLGLLTSAITFSGGLVTFGSADNAVVNEAVGNGLQNGWAGFSFVAPYIGSVLGVVLVIGAFYLLAKKGGGAVKG